MRREVSGCRRGPAPSPCSSVIAEPGAGPSPWPALQAISPLPSSQHSGQPSLALSPAKNLFPAKAARAGEGLPIPEPGNEPRTHLPVASGMLKDEALHPPLPLLEELGAAVVPQGELLDHHILGRAYFLAQVELGCWGGRRRAQPQLRLLLCWAPLCPAQGHHIPSPRSLFCGLATHPHQELYQGPAFPRYGESSGGYLSSTGSNNPSRSCAWTPPAFNMQLLHLGAVVQEGTENTSMEALGSGTSGLNQSWVWLLGRGQHCPGTGSTPRHPLTIIRAWFHDGHHLLPCCWGSTVGEGRILPSWKREAASR